MSDERPGTGSAVAAVRRWEELATDRTQAAERVADRRAEAQAQAVELLETARRRAEWAAAERRQQILDEAYGSAEEIETAGAAAVAALQAEAATKRDQLLRSALEVILPVTLADTPRREVGTRSDAPTHSDAPANAPTNVTARNSSDAPTNSDAPAGSESPCSSG